MSTGHDYSWFILTQSIIKKEFALSGSEQNPDLTGKSWRMTIKRATNKGAPAPVEAFKQKGADFIVRDNVEDLVSAMNALAGDNLLKLEHIRAQIEARDREIENPYVKDAQVMNLHNARRYIGDKLIRTAKPHRILDPAHGPLIAVQLNILNHKTGAAMTARTSWHAVANRERFGVGFPDGLNRAWADLRLSTKRAGRAPPKGTDDVAFIVKLIEKYIADGSADPKRIYVTGVSNGGAMALTLVCARADLFAAAASVIINLTDESTDACRPSRPVPLLMMNGTADPLIPYQGGGRGTSRFAVEGFWSTAKTLAFLR